MTYDVQLYLPAVQWAHWNRPTEGKVLDLFRRQTESGGIHWVMEPSVVLCEWLAAHTSSLRYIHELGRKGWPRGLLFAFDDQGDAVLMKLTWA